MEDHLPPLGYQHILSSVLSLPWAMLPEHVDLLAAILAHRVAGGAPNPGAYASTEGDATPLVGGYTAGSVGVMPLYGQIFPRANLMTESSGATSLQQWEQNLRALANRDGVKAIVLDVDSPGGSAAGLHEAAALVRDIREQMPVVAVTNHLNASAAYWISSQADEITTSRAGVTGSIGVLSIHKSIAVALENEGIEMSVISAGKYKTEGNPWEALGEDARQAIQVSVDEVYDQFVAAVANGRGAKPAVVRNGYGAGRALSPKVALSAGLVDGVETLAAVVERLQTGGGRGLSRRRSTMRAESEQIDEPVIVPDYGSALGAVLKGS